MARRQSNWSALALAVVVALLATWLSWRAMTVAGDCPAAPAPTTALSTTTRPTFRQVDPNPGSAPRQAVPG